MKTGRDKEFGTLLLVTLSAASLTVARIPSCASLVWMLATSLFFIGMPWLLWIGLRSKFAGTMDRHFPMICVFWTLLPVGVEFVLRIFDVGDLPIITMLVCFQNTALILGAFSHRQRARQIACLFAAFMALFATVIGTSLAVYLLAGLFGVMMLWWLMARYWERVQKTIAPGQTDRCLPLRSSVMGGVVIISTLLLIALGSTSASTYVIRGFMPSSGGTPWSDELASAGVGDGDAMVAAKEEATSFGPVDSELFLDSEMPSLYDMVNELYGDPVKPKKWKKSIALAPGEVKEIEQRIAKSKQSGREFSTLRRQAKRKRKTLSDRDGAAMLYVVGRTPLHLALERFDSFDGREWTHSDNSQPHSPIRLEDHGGEPWVYCMPVDSSPILRGLEPNAVKFINLKTNRIPSPTQLTAIHVHKIDRPDFFGWTDDSVVYMPERDHIPQLTVVHLRSQGLNLQSLRDTDFTAGFPQVNQQQPDTASAGAKTAEVVALHTDCSKHGDLVSDTAAEWTQNVPRGWQQVEAVVRHLRQDFTLDRQSTADADCDDVVSRFLTNRSGPDYLFATAAAMLLRELGYPTRLVTGFYARQDRFDRRAGQTPVLADDVHVWAEVYVGGNIWVAIEPTPGYEPPAENLTFRQWAFACVVAFLHWCRQHLIMLLAITAVLIIAFQTRRDWLAFLGNAVCRLMGLRSAEARIRWTLRLLSWRSWLAGCPRPAQKTITSWYSPLMREGNTETQQAMRRFLLWSERLLYSELKIDPKDHYEINHACMAAVIVSRHRRIANCLKINLSETS